VKIFGSIGRIGSGKDEVIKYLSSKCDLPVISVGDMVRKMAADKGLPLTRRSLHDMSATLFHKHGKYYFMSLVFNTIQHNQWERAGVTGIRTPDDVRFWRRRLGDDFVLFHVYVDDPRVRYERVRQRKSERDPQDYSHFMEQDKEEESLFHISEATDMADYRLDNSGNREDLHRQIDKMIEEECIDLGQAKSEGTDHG
jgi:dephospho-CoA kinase